MSAERLLKPVNTLALWAPNSKLNLLFSLFAFVCCSMPAPVNLKRKRGTLESCKGFCESRSKVICQCALLCAFGLACTTHFRHMSPVSAGAGGQWKGQSKGGAHAGSSPMHSNAGSLVLAITQDALVADYPFGRTIDLESDLLDALGWVHERTADQASTSWQS